VHKQKLFVQTKCLLFGYYSTTGQELESLGSGLGMQRKQSYGREKIMPASGEDFESMRLDQTSLFSFNHMALPPSRLQQATFDHASFGSSHSAYTAMYQDSHFVNIQMGGQTHMELDDDSTDSDSTPVHVTSNHSQYGNGHVYGKAAQPLKLPNTLKDTIVVRS
jgi:hypothetical protein